MGKPFKKELSALPATYEWARKLTRPSLTGLLGPAGIPLYVVGSGGSLSAAHHAAGLYEETVGAPARVETPLGLRAAIHNLRAFNVLFLSAGGSNPDILGACRYAIECEPRHLSVVCAATGSPLAAIARTYDDAFVLEFDLPTKRDGFLATNSLLATTVLLTRAIAGPAVDSLLPADLEPLIGAARRKVAAHAQFFARETLLVLHGSHTRGAAVDLESKLTEAALGRVQLADYRNFAHGRHHWLAKRPDESAVLALTTRDDRDLAAKTLALLPRNVPTLRIDTSHDAPVSSLSAMVSVFAIVDRYGDVRGIDPGRPGVPPFGRRIYHLNAFPANKSLRTSVSAPAVKRKLRAIGTASDALLERALTDAYDAQVSALAGRAFRALVLDYDGTICNKQHRYGTPPSPIIDRLLELLKHKIVIGVATGRGRSVRDALQQCLPKQYWPHVLVGYYNCGEVSTLADASTPKKTATAGIGLEAAELALRSEASIGRLCELESRQRQITVKAKSEAMLSEGSIWSLVNECIKRAGLEDVAVLSSSHSVDVVSRTCTKLDLLARLPESISAEDALCVGDRGRWPGNDWQLLNHRWSLSVDEASSAVDRAWNLAPAGVRGSHALQFYLDRIRYRRDRFVVDVRGGKTR